MISNHLSHMNLREKCLQLANQMAQEINGDLFYVPEEDIESCLSKLTEDNIEDVASNLAQLAFWFN